jgi:signal transduction histidine kinase
MSERRWYRSLYWRIAFGLAAFLLLLVTAQTALFVWMLDRTAGTMPARSPRRLAVLVASDVAAALTDNPALDLQSYVSEQYADVLQPFVVALRDGRVASNREDAIAERPDLFPAEGDRGERFPRDGRRLLRGRGVGRGGPPPGARVEGPGEQAWDVAPVLTADGPVGRVAVMETIPFSLTLREFGPQIASIGLTVLTGGILVIALLVFGPARRRLRALEDATEQLGTGDLHARAPEQGGDEVASLARSFNRMADDLAARAEALRASERSRRQLLADVSHELATPLTAMRGYVETLKLHGTALDAAARERYLGIIEDETHRLDRLIGELLDLARLEGGGGTLRREQIAVAALFERVIARHAPDIRSRGDRIAAHVGPGAESVEGDPDRLEQALQNLAANALRHTDRGTEITLSSRIEHGRLHLQVRDNGPGIAAEHLPQIFDRFYKADASRHAADGTGLGLSIVKAIVERHGGTITARNDGGAVFDIALPRPG